jgi:hypothetical protein
MSLDHLNSLLALIPNVGTGCRNVQLDGDQQRWLTHTHNTNSMDLKNTMCAAKTLQPFLVFLFAFYSRVVTRHRAPTIPTMTCSLCDVPGLPGSGMCTVVNDDLAPP